jgi:hypothetical protein
MKSLKLWQKAGLVAAIVGGLTLGGITPKYDSKGLESKLPTVGMSMAEAKETYQPPTELDENKIGFDGGTYQLIKEGDLDKNKIEDGIKETHVKIYANSKGQYISNYTTKGQTWAWVIIKDTKDTNQVYSLVDSNCNGIFEKDNNELYEKNKEFFLPDCLK